MLGLGTNENPLFQSRVETLSVPASMVYNDIALFQSQGTTPSMPSVLEENESSSFVLENVLSSMPYVKGADDGLFFEDQDVIKILKPWKYTFDLPFFQLQTDLHERGKFHKSFPLMYHFSSTQLSLISQVTKRQSTPYYDSRLSRTQTLIHRS